MRIWKWQQGAAPRRIDDELSVEEPLEIQIDTRPVSVTMRTPGHDAELAAGFLVTEALIRQREDIADIRPHPRNPGGNVINVLLNPKVKVDFARLTRHVFASSSCGLCGKASIQAVHQHFAPVGQSFTVPAELLLELPTRMRAAQGTFSRTGGLHAAALFSDTGELQLLREDVGRHNAVDKIVGAALLAGRLPLDRHILLVSGRASFEILQKALAAGIGWVAAVSAPSTLAAEFARANRQTLIGFLREGRFNAYAGRSRIAFPRTKVTREKASRLPRTKV